MSNTACNENIQKVVEFLGLSFKYSEKHAGFYVSSGDIKNDIKFDPYNDVRDALHLSDLMNMDIDISKGRVRAATDFCSSETPNTETIPRALIRSIMSCAVSHIDHFNDMSSKEGSKRALARC